MKKLLTVLLTIISCAAIAQTKPVQTIGVKSNIVQVLGQLGVDSAYLFPKDTINTLRSTDRAIAFKGTTAYKWDGTIWSVLMNGADTLFVETPLYVDTTSVPGRRILKILHADGLQNGTGIVTWTGTGLVFAVTQAIYWLNGLQYITPPGFITLSPSDPTNPRIDAIAVDTTSTVIKVTGTAAASPTSPSVNTTTTIVLTNVFLNANSLTPPLITLKTVYDELVIPPQWDTSYIDGYPMFLANTDNPYSGTKAVYIPRYLDGSSITFQDAGSDTATSDAILKLRIYLNRALPPSNALKFQFFNGATAVSSLLTVNNTWGFNKSDSNEYQNVSMPLLSAFTFPGGNVYNKLVISMAGLDISGAGGFYLDQIQIQKGLSNTGGSGGIYVDSVKTGGDSVYYYKNGIRIFGGRIAAGGSGSTNSNIGSGFRLVVPNTNNVKTLFNGYAIGIDSASNANALTLKADTSLLLTKLGAAAIYTPPQNLQSVTTVGPITTNTMFVGDTTQSYTAIRDSIYMRKKFNITSSLTGFRIEQLRSEKYNNVYDGIGHMGEWNKYLIRNYYNAGTRPGEILYTNSYNMNTGGSALIASEGAWANVIESDFNRKFESYEQVVLSTGVVYRPWMFVYNKDTLLNDMVFRSQFFHITPIDTAANYVNFQNGIYTFGHVPGHNTTVTHPKIEIYDAGGKTIALTNNSSALLFTGADNYVFDNTPYPLTTDAYDMGYNAANRWRNTFTQSLFTSGISAGYVAKTANYTFAATDCLVECTSGTFTLTLPTAVGSAGKIYKMTNTGSGTITIGTTSSQTFPNVTGTPTSLSVAQFTSYEFRSNGANWLAFKMVN